MQHPLETQTPSSAQPGPATRTVVQLLAFHPHSRRSMEIFLVALARQLRARGWRTIHVVSGEPGDYFRSELAGLDSQYIVAQFPLSLVAAWSLGKQLRRYAPDVVQTAFLSIFDPAVWIVKIVARAKHLIIADHSSGAASAKKGPKRFLARIRGALTGHYVTAIVAVSDFVRNRDISAVYLPANKIRTIHNGVEPQPLPLEGRHISAPVTIAFAGQLIPQKGVHVLLRAIKELSVGNTPRFRVLIAGQGSARDELWRYCNENGLSQVQFLGQVDWVRKLYESSDIVVVPSQWEEAFGLSIIEAMSCGACVVASDAGGIPEIVGKQGSAGIIFERSNAAMLASILRELIDDPHRRLAISNAARKRVTECFSLEKTVGAYTSLYRELAPLSRPPVRSETSPASSNDTVPSQVSNHRIFH